MSKMTFCSLFTAAALVATNLQVASFTSYAAAPTEPVLETSSVESVDLAEPTIETSSVESTESTFGDIDLTEALDQLEAARPLTGDYVEGEAIAIMADDEFAHLSAANDADYSIEPIMTVPESATLPTSEELAALSSSGTTSDQTINLVHSDTLDTESLMKVLESEPGVISVEPNYIYHLSSTDPDLTQRQYMAGEDTGINVPSWNQPESVNTTGDVVVAVVDSGVDYGHNDLKNVMWSDGLKYDELTAMGGGEYGFNATAYAKFDNTFAVGSPMDNNGHGTHCAGIIAAEWNGYGVSGVSNGAKLMAIKAANGAGQISAASAIAGYDYIKTAIDCGVNVKVANNSWGGDYGGRGVSLAVKALTDKGVVVVFASGNESSDVDQYPKTSFGMRNNPRVVVVNAVDDKGEYAGFSNYGANNTDVAAPGVNIMSTLNRPRSSAFLDISESISGNDFDTPSPYFSDWSATEGTTVEIVDRGNTGKCLAVSSSLKQSNIVTFDNMDVSSFRPRYLAFDFRVDADSPYGALVGMSAADIDGRKNAAFPVQSNSGCEKWQSYIFQLDDVDYRNFSVRLAGFCFDTAAGPADPNYEETMLFDNFRFYNDIYAYGALSGTSMACPVVSGEAAILVANFPDEPADKIAARIIGSAKRVDKHKDKCISGGIANLSNALAGHIAPVLFSAKRSETTVNKNASAILIDGYFFGDTPGTVTVDGAPAEVQAWNDVQIVITKPDALSPGNHLYEVTRPSGEESFRSGHRRFAIDSVGALRSITGIADVIEDNRISDMTTLHGKVYLLMNDDFNNISLYEYNPVTNGFLECFRAPHRTCASSMVTYGGEILLITGDTRFKEMEYEVIRYEPCAAKLSYHELEASSAFAVGATLVAYGDDLLTLGGINMGTMSVSNAICRLSLTDYTVEPVGQLAMGRAGCSTFSQKGDDTGLYACFGSDLSGTINSIERIEKVGDEYVGTVIQDYTKEDVASINFGAIAFTESAEGAFVYGLRQFDEYGTVITDACSLYFSDKEPVFTVHDDLIYGKFLSNPCSVICNGHYYLAGSTDDGQVVFGEVGGFADVDRSGDVYPRASVTVGGLTLSYQSYIEYTGTAIKFPDLGVTITDGSGRSFELGSVSYKANKNAGTATFTVKTLKNVSKDIKKLFAKTPITFTILKRTLTMDNTEVKFNKKGAVTSVKYFWTYTNNKGKLLTKRFTVPKKDYYYADGSIVIKETSKNYTGDFSPSTGKEAIK